MRFSTKKAVEKAENSLMRDFCNFGQYSGFNVMEKTLTYIKQCFQKESEQKLIKSY